MREKIIAGNWKLNGDWSLCEQFIDASQRAHVADNQQVSVLICPPVTLLQALAEALSGTGWFVGAQNVSSQISGAFTGEISASMLKSAGAQYSIVGHSERRTLFFENDAVVAEKLRVVIEAGIRPILCVGEDLDCREAGNAEDFVVRQIKQSTVGLSREQMQGLIVAYEPIWAIGTGKTASAQQAQAMHALIRRELSLLADNRDIPLLYGGSVKAENAAELLAQDDIDGALVGGASLDAETFLAIVNAA